MKIDIICVSRMRSKHQLELIDSYLKRMTWKINIREIDPRKNEEKQFLSMIKPDSALIALDEKGKNLTSIEFAKKIEATQNKQIQFLIGGADGLQSEIKAKANLSISFGQLTWPHMLVRIMLTEQLYRAQQILAGHPYHRE